MRSLYRPVTELSPVNGRIGATQGVLEALNLGLTHRFDYGEWRAAMQSIEERFWAKVDKTPTCWIWRGARGPAGYGTISRDGKNQKAHRVGYELTIGPIPDGLTLDHVCGNTSCVNPDHLEPVTLAENIRRAVPARALKQSCKRDHPYSEHSYIDIYGRRVCRECKHITARQRRANGSR